MEEAFEVGKMGLGGGGGGSGGGVLHGWMEAHLHSKGLR